MVMVYNHPGKAPLLYGNELTMPGDASSPYRYNTYHRGDKASLLVTRPCTMVMTLNPTVNGLLRTGYRPLPTRLCLHKGVGMKNRQLETL